jgi:hypothetical protein
MNLHKEAFHLSSYYGDREDRLEHGEIIPYEGYDGSPNFQAARANLPPLIRIQAHTTALHETDVPHTDLHPVITNRVWDCIRSFGPVDVKPIPVQFEDRQTEAITKGQHVYLHQMVFADLLDREASRYKESKALPGSLRVRHLVLACPQNGFPPMFRVLHDETKIFVNGEVKQALEAMGATGMRFFPVEVSGA